ncbi:hypothetical protein [Leptospira levettii]|uniref:hypothetical protein n=1 Tax=Leptospira levettii TaxID=2023178 RepID=UPI001082B6CE|nr:hypothetical protein [Leptospira levettii]TGK92574.1 hypothetical protein EHQ34_18340 [Leptospira levettii]
MNKLIRLLLLMHIVLFSFFCNTSIKKNETADYNIIAKELIARGYYVKIRNAKSPYSVVTGYPNTNVLEGDFQKICSIPNLTFLTLDKEYMPHSFFENLSVCNLETIDYLNLRNTSLQEGVLCNLIVRKPFQTSLFLSNTNISDSDLPCIRKIEKIENLSIKGPSQKFSDEAFCNLMHSGLSVKTLDLRLLSLSQNAVNCLLDLSDIEYLSFRKIKGRSSSDMKKLEELYFKKNGRKVTVDVFEYDSP